MQYSEVGVKLRKVRKHSQRSLIDSSISYWPLNPRKSKCPTLFTSPVFYVSFVSFLCAFTLGLFFLLNHGGYRYDIAELEFEKCPACFGQSACPTFFRGDVRIPFAFWKRIPDSYRISVYYEPYSKNRSIVHLLQYPASSKAIDAAVCQRGAQSIPDRNRTQILNKLKCTPHLAIWRWRPTSGPEASAPLEAHMLTVPPIAVTSTFADLADTKSSPTGYSPFVRCATPRLLSLIRERFTERTSFNAPTKWLRFDELTLLFNLAINPHAVILQTFSAHFGWPFPNYIGACGRLVVEHYSGDPLFNFIKAPRRHRLEIIRSMLTLPIRLRSSSGTSPDSDFSLYLADFGWKNFVVDPVSREVALAGTRHLIAVDLLMSRKFNNSMYTVTAADHEKVIQLLRTHALNSDLSESDAIDGPTPTYLSLAHADALCNHSSSDHNLWAVCFSILHGGDLSDRKDVSENFLSGLPDFLVDTIHGCLHDSVPGARHSHVQEAIKFIENELNTI